MSNTCTSQPISWLRLEQHRLGDLSADDSRRLEAHLAECELCRTCLNAIREQEAELRPLPVAERRFPVLRWATMGLGLAAAAAVAMVLLTADWEKAARQIPSCRIALKGGELSISLVRERGGVVLHQPETFAPMDRFKLLVTCPQTAGLFWDVVVFQGQEASFPYTPGGSLGCGNQVPLPGAFTLVGEYPALICLVTGSQAPDRAALSEKGVEDLPPDTVCLELKPVP